MESKTVSAQYLAGFVDGEGCIYIHTNWGSRQYRKRPRIVARLTITNTHLPTLLAIHKEWGGRIHKRDVKKHYGRGKDSYQLDWNSHVSVLAVLKAIQPFAIAKKEQIDLFLTEYVPTMMETGRTYHLSESDYTKRLEVKEKLSTLKRVEFKHSELAN